MSCLHFYTHFEFGFQQKHIHSKVFVGEFPGNTNRFHATLSLWQTLHTSGGFIPTCSLVFCRIFVPVVLAQQEQFD